jgi:diacylglycerol kinase (ATP)
VDRHPLDGWSMVVCNPMSGSGRGLARLGVVRRALDEAGRTYEYEVTTSRGDPARIAQSAVAAGCCAVIVIGGDGTLFEVVNGVMYHEDPDSTRTGRDRVAVGLVQAGRGSDFGRSVGIPTDVQAACKRLIDGRTTLVDLGHLTYRAAAGKERSRFFANAAGLGFDAEVSQRANGGPRVLGGTIPYLTSLLLTLGTYRNKRLRVSVDGAEPWEVRANSLVLANGQYFGGGMKIAPEAVFSDGILDITLLGDLGKVDLVRNVPRVYDGSHATHPKVKMMRARRVEVTSDEQVLIQADGEVLGTTPAVFNIVPQALRVIV